MQNKLQTVSTKDLFKYPSVPSITINQFGILGFGILDTKSLLNEAPVNYTYAINTSTNDNKETNESKKRTVDDTILDKIIENETNQNLNNITNYIKNATITNYNDHTGIFEGKNLIVIMMESANEIIINKDLYPNFYKLYTEGISFKNNFSPRNSCSTGNNEFSGMTGLYTIQNNCTANIYRDNTYFTSIFNLFKDAGYKTSSMHNYTEHYYARSIIHKNLGSDIYYGVQDLGINYYNVYKDWSSDEDFMNAAMDITLNNNATNPYMLWLTTVSSHQPYGVSSEEGDKYLSITENSDYSMELRRYMSKLKTLDNSLGILLERLKASNTLDDTVIVLYGDHYPYGLKTSELNEISDTDRSDKFEMFHTSLILYNSEIEENVKVTKYVSSIDVLPTIYNLFGIKYDSRLLMGRDALSDAEGLVILSDRSFINEFGSYNSITGKYTKFKEDVSNDYIEKLNHEVYQRFTMSSLLLYEKNGVYLDYYRKLGLYED